MLIEIKQVFQSSLDKVQKAIKSINRRAKKA